MAGYSEPGSIRRNAAAGVGALGVVFGDIGTSPLYTFKTVLDYTGLRPDAAATLGALSLILWTIFLVTTIKYVNFAMRVDNDGEGGIIALLTLLGVKKRQRPVIVAVGLFGAALIYGDGAITPAISVLSALEGVEQIAPSLQNLVLPAAVVILFAIFAIWPLGTATIGRTYGPIIAGVVRDHCRAGRQWDCPVSAGLHRDRSALWLRLPVARRFPRVSRTRRRVPVRDRVGGVVCRHGSLRSGADPPFVVYRGLSGSSPQLRRAGCDRARRLADRRQHLLPALPDAAADADDRCSRLPPP